MPGGKHHPEAFACEEHANSGGLAFLGEHFGVAGVGNAGEMPGFFANGGGDEGIEGAIEAGVDSGLNTGGGGSGGGADVSGI